MQNILQHRLMTLCAPVSSLKRFKIFGSPQAMHAGFIHLKCCLYEMVWDLLDLIYKMGSQRQWTVFELLDLLSAVNMQLYVCHKINGIIQASFGNFIH